MFCSIDVFKTSTSDRKWITRFTEKWKKKLGVTNFVSEVKGVENKFEFENLVSVSQHMVSDVLRLKYERRINGDKLS